MPTLSEFQADMALTTDPQKAAAAGMGLANYYFLYNEEFNALIAVKQKANAALSSLTHNSSYNTSDALRLESLVLSCKSRMKILDEQMWAFHNSGLDIKMPNATLIKKVKKLSAEVAEVQIKANAVTNIMTSLTKLAELTAQVQAA